MAEGKNWMTSKSRIESLSDLIFGLALSIGALTLIGQPQNDFGQILQSILFYAFSFLILISVWYGYTRTMSLLHIETSKLVNLNILLLFLVSIEPFLFNQLINPVLQLARTFQYCTHLTLEDYSLYKHFLPTPFYRIKLCRNHYFKQIGLEETQ
jgi:uncharacterized membrane protein